ncbi:carbohydrate ABC transporter permease [Brockia lithotrophica]|uniref:Maltose/maltodextrin transport system permease protein n=1 Tax=Brockia lithotrophica TaxID=933949 RepID=A0A660L0M1_9BACL|nr:sugar ABC transporter permease [Brockia lithotrophica]RKQ84129.1 carbohydrate ABC transporter membrane protein 1 (CUT1 family) [Brockia lithotrophica]
MHVAASSASRPVRLHARRAAVLSVLGMGFGQMYNGQFAKGAVLFAGELAALVLGWAPFRHAMWGLVTLGETPQIRQGGRIVVAGDHSIFLLIEGLLALFVFALFLLLYAGNVWDAYRTGALRDEGRRPPTLREEIRIFLDRGYPFLLLAVPVLFVLFTIVLPLVFGVLIAFTNYSSPYHLPPRSLVNWVGLETFRNLFQLSTWSRTFWGILWWNVVWATLATLSTYFLGLGYAVLLGSKVVRGKRFWRTLYILPWAFPQFVSLLIFRNFLNQQFGPLNRFLVSVGLPSIPWLSDPFWAKVSVLLVNLWLGFPYWMMLMSGVLTGIDRELYEAAAVDGARGWQAFRHVTLPLVFRATGPLLIMSFAFNFNNFNVIYLLTSGGPANPNYSFAGHTDILISWIYKLTLEQSQFNMASAVSLLIFLFVAGISLVNFRNTRAFREEELA